MPPIRMKNVSHRPSCVRPSSKPNTTSIDSSGITARTPSTRPRLVGSVVSVTHALKAASFAVAPKIDMMQSSTITAMIASITACAVGEWPGTTPTRISPNAAVVSPQRMYPITMKGFRRPTRSERAPINIAASVAAIAEEATSAAITSGFSVIVL